MNHRRQLLSNAISERFRELCDRRIPLLDPDEFGEQSSFVSQVKREFTNASIETFQQQQPKLTGTFHSKPDGMAALRALALGELVVTGTVENPTADQFLHRLKSSRKDQSQSLQLLVGRYRYPLNFTDTTEGDVREFILEGLMVRDRKRIEERTLASADEDYLWYRLNLIGVYSYTSSDLRFLDALNYYYELIPEDWRSRSQNTWLLVSFLSLYARALAAKGEDVKCG